MRQPKQRNNFSVNQSGSSSFDLNLTVESGFECTEMRQPMFAMHQRLAPAQLEKCEVGNIILI